MNPYDPPTETAESGNVPLPERRPKRSNEFVEAFQLISFACAVMAIVICVIQTLRSPNSMTTILIAVFTVTSWFLRPRF